MSSKSVTAFLEKKWKTKKCPHPIGQKKSRGAWNNHDNFQVAIVILQWSPVRFEWSVVTNGKMSDKV